MTEDSAVYLHVTIQLVRGKHRIFAAAMAEMAPVLESQGWRLVGAFTPGIGRLGAVYHLWRVPSPDGVLDALDRGAGPSRRRALARGVRRVRRRRDPPGRPPDALLPHPLTAHRPTTA